MADRRRRPHSEGESDEESTETSSSQSPRKPRQSECESEGETKEVEVSDYESAEDNADKEEEEDEEEEETDEDEEEEDDEEEDDDEEYEDEDVIIEEYDEVREERQSGDGEEQPDNKKLDDDEDRKNPAFIPRQGAFYEHDLRLGEDGNEDDKRPRKKLWQDEGKWYHDRYSDNMQGPKSREELIVMYGYDIRQSDKPPDAPPPRRGGPRRPRMGDKPHLSDFIQSRDDSYLIEKRNNEYNKNRYFRGKSEEFHKQDEEQEAQPSHSGQDERYQPEKYDQWNSRFEENQSYRRNQESNRGYDRNRRYSRNREGDRGYGRDSNRDYGRNQDSRRGSDRNYDSNRRNQDYDQGYDRNQDSNRGYDRNQDSNRGYDRSWRDNDNRSPRYDNRNYRDYRNDSSSNYDYQRGGRYNNRGYRNDAPRRDYTYSRDRGPRYRGGGRSRPDRGRGGPPRRTFETERKIPPRFQKKKEARLQGNYNDNYIDNEHMQNYYPEHVVDNANYEEEDQYVQSAVKTEVFTPSNLQENVEGQQTETVDENIGDKSENVIVQSNVSERNKSYSKDRRVRTVGKTRVQDSALNAVQEGISNLLCESEAPNTKSTSDRGDQRVKQSQGNTEKFQTSKQDGGRTKRYSSQRQRNPEQLPQENVQYFAPDVPKGYPKKDVGNPQFTQPVLRPPINYPIPVSTSALPNAPPQRLFRPPPVTGPVPIIPPQFINTAGVIYGPPPAPAPYPVAPIQGFPSPPPVSTAPPPPIPPGAGSSPNQLQEVYRHGTTYYPPELQYPHQMMKKRSPVKRTKSAIPIVNPEEIPSKMYDEDGDGDKYVDDGEMVDDRDTKLQQNIDREFGFDENSDTPPLYEHQPLNTSVIDPGDVSEEKDSTNIDTTKNVDIEIDDLSSNMKRLTTDISNYTIAFSTEQEEHEKGDNPEDTSHEERTSPVSGDKERTSPVTGDKERTSPVSGDKNDVLQEKSSPVPEEDISVPPSTQEVSVS